MSEAWEGTKKTIKGLASIPIAYITPTKNRYSSIAPNEDDRSTGSNESPPDSDSESKSDSESEDSDDEERNMTKTTVESVKDLVEDSTVLIPKPHPSLMDVIDFKREVINALTLCPLRGNLNGHSFILETNVEYNLRNRTVIAQLPKPPSQATQPGADAKSREWRIFNRAEAAFDLYANYNKQVIGLIKTAFPASLVPLYVEGHLSPETTALTAINTLTDAVKDNLATQDCLTTILDAQPRRKYIPNSNGPRDYFEDCEKDARMARRLGEPINISTTMLYAQRAFTLAHPDSKVEIRKLMAEWITKKRKAQVVYAQTNADAAKAANVTAAVGITVVPPANVPPEQLYTLFKIHYSNKIKELFTDSNTGHRANHVQERTDERLEGIEDGLTELAMALKAVTHNRTAQDRAIPDRTIPGSIRAPTDHETVAGLTLASDPQFQSMIESQRALSAQVQNMMQSMTNNTGQPPAHYRTERGNPQGGRDNGGRGHGGRYGAMDNVCRQYRMWCWSCGVNLSHNSGNCNTHKTGHIDTATYASPQGGNLKKNARHMKWRHPISGATIDQCVNI